MRSLQIGFSISYGCLISYLVFFARRRQHLTERLLNVTPLRSLYQDYTRLETYYSKEGYHFYVNLLGNIILFIPLPLILWWFLKSQKNNMFIIYLCVALSISIETSQYIFIRGVADINDILLNTTGALIGLHLKKRIVRVA